MCCDRLKVYSTADGQERVAVAGLELNLFEGEISVILGHNGAGVIRQTVRTKLMSGVCR